MRPFRYERPADRAAALASIASSPSAAFLAGGTSLVDVMKLGVVAPDVLVDVRAVTSDRVERLPDGGLRIGAAVSNSDLAASRDVRRAYPVLAQAVVSGASGQVRNIATVAGNLLQRPRCVYYRNVAMPCNRRSPGAGCAARDGYQRAHAILGAPDACIATHPSDMAVALAALDAVVRTERPAGERTVPLVELYCAPGEQPDRDTVLDRDELIVAVDVPPSVMAARSSYRKVRDRASFAFALVSVAAALHVEDGRVRDVRLALGGVAHRPWRATVAEQQLRDAPATERNFGRALDAELATARPLAGNAFKVVLARRAALRSLLDLLTKETP